MRGWFVFFFFGYCLSEARLFHGTNSTEAYGQPERFRCSIFAVDISYQFHQ